MEQKRRIAIDDVRFYATCISLALSHLHNKRVIYRDLKPENILLSKDGYAILADFGLAKNLGEASSSNSYCGTPEYLCKISFDFKAPEMILGSGHDHTLDWWCLGVLIYEMLVGIPPFYDKNQNKMLERISRGKIYWPDQQKHGLTVALDAQDLISKVSLSDLKLCDKEKATRLGRNGAQEVLSHPFFSSVNIQGIL